MENKERLQKILARAGIASRRKAEELIRDGLVTINGRVAQIGDKAEMGKDAIKVSGKLIHHFDAPMYLLFNKPKGVLCTLSDPEGRPTIAEFLGRLKKRIFPVGRLDFNTEGLLLLTNDGQFAADLQKQAELLRVYHAKVKGHPTREDLERLAKGGRIGPRHQLVRPYSVRLAQGLASKSVIELSFQGSATADLKAYLEFKGFLVEKITRTAIGHMVLGELPPGEYRVLKPSQVEALINQPDLAIRRLKYEEEMGPEQPREPDEKPEEFALPVAHQERREKRPASHAPAHAKRHADSRPHAGPGPRPTPKPARRPGAKFDRNAKPGNKRGGSSRKPFSR